VRSSTAAPARAGGDVLARLRDPDLLRGDLFVDGEWVAAGDGARFEVHDPATGDVIGAVASATREDTRIAIAAAAAASSLVAGRRCAISTKTGRPVRMENPASPWSSDVSQSQYWIGMGLSSPKYARRLASCSGVRAVEVPSRAAMASPGMSRMKRNVRKETPMSVGIAPRRRFAR
jgi:hypothetical protein